MTSTPLSWSQTWALIASDARRLIDACGGGGLGQRVFWLLMPNYQALFWYRISRYCFVNGWRRTARMVFLFNVYLTRVEIPPTSEIGESCLIGHASGILLYGRIGARATIYGDAKLGGGVDNSIDIGGGPGYPVLGDDVTLGYRAAVLGPYKVGNRVRCGPFALVMFDVADGTKVTARKSLIMRPDPRPADADAAAPVAPTAPDAAPTA